MKTYTTDMVSARIVPIYVRTLLQLCLIVLFFGVWSAQAHAGLTYVGGHSGGSNTTSWALTLTTLSGGTDTAPQEGDIVIVLNAYNDVSDTNPGVTTSGYTELADLYSNDTHDVNFSVSWKIMGSSPDTSVTCNGSADALRGSVCIVHVWRGVDQTTPIDVAIQTVTGMNSATPDAPSVTPVTEGAVVLALGGGVAANGDATVTIPTGYENERHSSFDPTNAVSAGIVSKAWSGSGAEDPGAWSAWAGGTGGSWAAATLALRPAQGLTLAGVLYDGSVPETATSSIKVAISTSSTPTIYSGVSDPDTGAWNIFVNGLTLPSGTPITVWVDGQPDIKANLVTRAGDSSNYTDLDLYKDGVVLRHEDAGPLTLDDLNVYDSTENSDIQYHASSSMEGGDNWFQVNTGIDVLVETGMTFEGSNAYYGYGGGLTNNGTITETGTETSFIGPSATVAGTGGFEAFDLYISSVDFDNDGETWEAQTASESNSWRSVTYGEGLFVAVANTGTNRVMTSPDGVNWTARSAAAANEWNSVTYGNGMFVAVADTGTNRVMTSPDGINWTIRAAGGSNTWFGVTYGNGTFVAVADSGTDRAMTSTDGITWTSRAIPSSAWNAITYGEGLFVAVAYSGTDLVATSPDGITWTARTASADSDWYGVAYGDGTFVAVANLGTTRAMTSTDGITWESQTIEASDWYGITFGNGLFVAVADVGTNRIATSPDGVSWTPQTATDSTEWSSVAYGNTAFVAVSEGGSVMTSYSGTYSSGQATFSTNATTTNLTISTSAEFTYNDTLTILGDYYNTGISSAGEGGEVIVDVSTGEIINGYDLTVASYDSVSLGVTETKAYGMDFSRDGTNLYVIGFTSDNIRWYTLGTPWDISTATYEGLYYMGGLDDFPNALAINNDGTKVYFTGDNNDAVAELTLSTPYDITSASYDSAFFFTEETSPLGVAFNDDGTLLYISGDSSDSIHSYTLSPAWDISTAVYADSFSMSAQNTSVAGSHFSTDGTQLFVSSHVDEQVNEYALSTPFDISTASYVQNYSYAAQVGNEAMQVRFSDDGVKMFVLDVDSVSVHQYTTGSIEEGEPGDTNKIFDGTMVGGSAFGDFTIVAEDSTVTFFADAATGAFTIGATATVTAPSNLYVTGDFTNNGGFDANGGSLTIEAIGGTSSTSVETVVVDAFDVSTAVYEGAYNIGAQEDSVTGLAVSADGTRMYVIGYSGDDVNQYALSTPFDVTTATVDGTPFSFAGQDDFGEAIDFSSDGTKMFILGSQNDRVYQYTLSSAWDVTSASYDSAFFSVQAQDGSTFGLAFSTDGTKMYMLGSDNDRVFSYTLGTPWSVASASYDSVSYLVSGQETTVEGLTFNDDGTRMYVTGASGDDVNQYALGTPWDISTASVEGSPFSVAGQETYPVSVVFSTNGAYMFILGTGSQEINAYTIGSVTEEEVATGGSTTISGNLTGSSAFNDLTLTFPETYTTGGVTWESQSAIEANSWNSVTYGEGLFVAVSSDGTDRVMTSVDGETWEAASGGIAGQWNSVTYGNGLFVAVTGFGTDLVMTSSDGETWTAQVAPAGFWYAVTYGNGLFVAVGTTGEVMTSPDGETWTAQTAAEANQWSGVTYGNGLFVAVSSNGTNRVMTSPDGETWTAQSATEANEWRSVTYGNGTFVAVAQSGTNRVMTSFDGETWEAQTATEAAFWENVTYGDGLFVAVATVGTNQIMTSPDGINWTARSAPEANEWKSVVYGEPTSGNGKFVAVTYSGTNRVMTSDDGYIATGTIAFAGNASTSDLIIGTEFTEVVMPDLLTISGDYSNSGSVVGLSDAHVYANGASAQSFSGSMTGDQALGSIDFSGAGTKTFSDNASTSAVTISAESTVVAPSALTIHGDFTNDGTFDAIENGGTLYIEGDGSVTTSSQSTWDVTTAIISGSTFSFASQETLPTGINFSEDGTAMYVVGWTGDDINQYALSSPWDITTASVDGTPFLVSSQGSSPDEIEFNESGTRMFLLDQGEDEVNQYDLGTAWDVTTATYDTVFSVASQDGSPSGLAFNTDGTKMYIAGYVNDNIYQYSLGTPWDIGTASYDSVFLSIGAVENEAEGLQFKPDGTKMYVLGNASVSPYTLSTPWDITTAVFDGSAEAVVTGSYGFAFGKDGEYMYVTSDTNDTVNRYALDLEESTTLGGTTYTGNMSGTSALYVVVIDTPQSFDADGTPWVAQDESENSTWSSIAYGEGLFVALAYSGTNRVMTSPDGITWTSRSAAEANSWNAITYGEGRFVAVAGNGTNQVMTSEDGITWTARSASAANEWYAVTYGDGQFVAVAHNNAAGSATCSADCVMTSPDGITWTSQTAAAFNKWEKIVYGEGLFVAVSSDGTDKVMTSPDGITWTSRNVPGNGWYGLAYGNGTFVAVAYDWVITSPDGITWTTQLDYEANGWQDVTYGGGLFVAVSPDGTNRVMTSSNNGVNWTPRGAPASNKWWAVTFGVDRFVSVAQQTDAGATCTTDCVMISTAGDLYGGLTFDTGALEVNDITVVDDAYVTLMPEEVTVTGYYTNDGTIVYPTNATTTLAGNEQSVSGNLTGDSAFDTLIIDSEVGSTVVGGDTWTPQTAATTDEWSAVTYGEGLFVAVSWGGTVMTSEDGITWTERNGVSEASWYSVTHAEGMFVAVGDDQIMTSLDGLAWTSRTPSEAGIWWGDIVYGEGRFVAVGVANTGTELVMTSEDGITWTTRTAGAYTSWTSVAYGNGTFVAVSSDATNPSVMTSEDGITWTAHNVSPLENWESIAYGNGTFVAIGIGGAMTSPDGITWTAQTPAEASTWKSLAYGDGLFVAVSNDSTNRVMTSPDGITWTAQSAGFNDDSWLSVTYGNGTFVAVGHLGDDQVMTSDSGSRQYGTVRFQDSVYADSLVATTPGVYVEFPAYATSTFVSFELTGALGNETTLRSTVDGSQWGLDVDVQVSVSYLDVSDSNACSGNPNITATDSIDSGNNTCWEGLTTPVEGAVSISSLTNQVFVLGQPTTTISTITITEGGTPTITAVNDLRISIDTVKTDMLWDTTDTTAVIGGTASAKVSSTVSYEDGGATLVIPVSSDFIGGDTLTISGLSFGNFNATSSATSTLGLYTEGEIPSAGYDISTGVFSEIALSVAAQETAPTKMLFNNTGDTLYVMGLTGDDINAYTLSVPYDISTATFSEIALSVAAQEVNPMTMLFNNTGDTLYVMGYTGDDINAYTLSVPYDISTATFSEIALSVAAQDSNPFDLLFNGDGTVLYMLGTSGADINAYTLSVPYDISTATFSEIALSVIAQDGVPRGMIFNNTGDTLYVIGASGVDINAYTLSVPYDISTGVFDEIALSVATEENNPSKMLFNNTGDTLYVIGLTGDDINAYSLDFTEPIPNALDDKTIEITEPPEVLTLSSASDQVFALGQPDTTVSTITVFEGDTPTITAVDDLRISIDPAKTDMRWDTSDTSAVFGGSASAHVSNPVSYENGGLTLVVPVSIDFEAGDSLTIGGLSYGDFGSINIATSSLIIGTPSTGSYDIATGVFDEIALSVAGQELDAYDMLFNDDGTILYVMGVTGDDINAYTLSTPYDISTGVFDEIALYVGGQELNPVDIEFNGDGTILYVLGLDGDDINAYNLSTPYDISTGVFDEIALSIAPQNDAPIAMTFNNDGTVLYVSGSTGDSIYAYDLSVPYDISTATFDEIALYVGGQDTSPFSILFNNDGTIFYMLGAGGDDINAYNLSVPFDVSTGVFDEIALSITNEEFSARAMIFNNDGTVLYMMGSTGDDINAYTLDRTAGDVSAEDDKTITITGALVYGEHDAGQADSVFSFQNQDDTALYRFRLTPNGEGVSITQLALEVSGARKITTSNLTDLRLYRDYDADGEISAGDVQIGGAGVFTIGGQAGAITFSGAWTATTTLNYIVTSDVDDIMVNEYLTLTLEPSGITNTGSTTGAPILPYGEVTSVQHIRVGGSGGGGAIGGEAPEGDGDVGGGGQDGGDGAGEDNGGVGQGANIGNEAGFVPPSTTGAQFNQWINGANAYVSDNTNTQAQSSALNQSYGGFGFSIPETNTIVGIAVKLEGSGSGGGNTSVSLSWNAGSNYTSAKSTNLTGTETVFLLGGAGDTWGRTWSPNDFTSENFVLRITSLNGPDGTNYVDAIQIRIYHQTGGGGGGGGGDI